MSTHNIHLKYRTSKRYSTVISIMPPGVALIVTFRGSNNRCLEQIFMVPKGFEPSKFDCSCIDSYRNGSFDIKYSISPFFHFMLVIVLLCTQIGSVMNWKYTLASLKRVNEEYFSSSP